MSWGGVLAFTAKEFGWTIDEVGELSIEQLNIVIGGLSEINPQENVAVPTGNSPTDAQGYIGPDAERVKEIYAKCRAKRRQRR